MFLLHVVNIVLKDCTIYFTEWEYYELLKHLSLLAVKLSPFFVYHKYPLMNNSFSQSLLEMLK